MNELGPDARALLDVARDGDDPTHDDRARLRRSIGARLAIGAAAAGVAITAATTSSASAAGATASVGAGAAAAGAGAVGVGAGAASIAAPIGIGMKLLLVFGAATAIGVGAVSYVESSPQSQTVQPPSQTTARPPTPVAPIASQRPASTAKPVAPTATTSAIPDTTASSAPSTSAAPQATNAPAAVISSPTTSPSAIDRELGLVREALAAVQSGDGARALVLLDEHARRYPSGALAEEREATRVFALCSLGRVAEARASADRFLRAFPRSPQAARVRSSCGGDPTSF